MHLIVDKEIDDAMTAIVKKAEQRNLIKATYSNTKIGHLVQIPHGTTGEFTRMLKVVGKTKKHIFLSGDHGEKHTWSFVFHHRNGPIRSNAAVWVFGVPRCDKWYGKIYNFFWNLKYDIIDIKVRLINRILPND